MSEYMVPGCSWENKWVMFMVKTLLKKGDLEAIDG